MSFITPTPPTKDTVIGAFENPYQNDIYQVRAPNGNLLISVNYLGVFNVPTAPVSIAPLVSVTTLSTSQLLNLSTTPVLIIPPLAANKIIAPQFFSLSMKFGGTPFSIANAGAGNTYIYWNGLGSGSSGSTSAGTIPDTVGGGGMNWTASTSQFYTLPTFLNSSYSQNAMLGQGMSIAMDDALSVGNGSLLVTISYVIVTVA